MIGLINFLAISNLAKRPQRKYNKVQSAGYKDSTSIFMVRWRCDKRRENRSELSCKSQLLHVLLDTL
jgi:hypothetical protein